MMRILPAHILALNYLERAEEFMQAFRNLQADPPPAWPRYFLLTHAVELALRTYLIQTGVPDGKLRGPPLRHNLKQLLIDSVNAGLPVRPAARREIELLDEAHRRFWHRYPREVTKPVFVIDYFEAHGTELLQAVRRSLHPTSPPT